MFARGVEVSYETIRAWCDRFGRRTRTSCAGGGRGRAIHGTLMRCLSRLTAHSGTCGVRSTSTATCSTFWSSRAERVGRKEVSAAA